MGKFGKKGHAPRAVRDDEEELEQGMGGFFGEIGAAAGGSGGSAAPVSARKQSRLDAEADECIAKYGAAPVKYEAATGADLDISREKAKSLIAARVAASAKKQKEKLPTKSKAARKLAREADKAKSEADFQARLAEDMAKGKKKKNWAKREDPGVDATQLVRKKSGKKLGRAQHEPRLTARVAKKMV
eukprot:CAMPEP_0174838864 /NCGR_PEP_ID=MMETSP1114-20130205/7675_1 /TAXON_ID=312471 /ORGANISM="Neobodo designis, Strain CCAP 1951/1" /LENGTH=186 /DNA_ID=CAMNT_0016072975 /DNA_START=51 /DNA_END=607 /DNA_ORIENTATION=+